MKFTATLFLLLALSNHNAPPDPHPNCCLCMCRAKDETRCSRMCVRLQHGKKIVEEPEMKVCTRVCKRKGVKTI